MEIRAVKNKKRAIQTFKYHTKNGDPNMCPANGVAATFWAYELNPDLEKLIPLARFLFENLKGQYVGGGLSHPAVPKTVCYNGKTEADMVRKQNRSDAEHIIRAYDLENVEAKIDDWRFRYIYHDESDEDYLNAVARDILLAGSVKVKIKNKIFEVPHD